MSTRRLPLLALVAAMAIAPCISRDIAAQVAGQEPAQSSVQSDHQANDLVANPHPKAEPSTSLTLNGPDSKTLKLSLADFKAMPHKNVVVHNEHTRTEEAYAGVPLTDLLTLIGVPMGKDLHGKAFLIYLLAEGTDHYRVLYSLSEVDPVNHTGEVIVADTLNNAPIIADGAFKLVNSEDKRPARWVRNLSTITIQSAAETESHH
jgi:hypothetical protein